MSRIQTHPLSSGAKKDLLVLFFAKATLKVLLAGQSSGTIERDRSNKNHHINKRVDRRIERLIKLIDETTDDLVTPEIGDWLQRKNRAKVYPLLMRIQDTPMQLDTLAYYIMYVNFCERKKPLDDRLKAFADDGLYFDDIDLIKKAGISDDTESSAMYMAYSIIEGLKA